jgi:hypothetical protein
MPVSNTPVASKPISNSKRKTRTKGGCCGCFILALALLIGVFWLARKWAPNHLNQGLEWGRGKITEKAPIADRFLPHYTKATPVISATPMINATPMASATPIAAITPAPVATPAFEATPAPFREAVAAGSGDGAFTDVQIGTGAEVKIGQSILVKYASPAPKDAPELFMVGAGEVSAELESGVLGMKVGGKRKLAQTEVELIRIL